MLLSFFRKNLFGVLLLISLCCHYAVAEILAEKSTIAINGSHSITVRHDKATIQGSVITENTQAQKAVQDNADILEKIRKALKNAQIDPQKLLSRHYQLVTQYDYIDGKQNFKNYQVTHDIAIETDKIDSVGEIADLLTSSGVNQISNIEFTSSKSSDAYDDALKNAVLDANTKAHLAVSMLDAVKVGKILKIDINPSEVPIQPVMYKAMALSDTAKQTPTNFQTNGQTITVNVHTLWELMNNAR